MSVLVSINCITYNHEKYLVQALESFLNQETNFKFEILIHDDASTDSTPDIIKYYEKKYPKIIKPIYQSDNQFSKGRKPWLYNLDRAKGQYIAECEGDDYWADSNKLQKQIDYLENNPGCTLTFHNAELINDQGDSLNRNLIDKNLSKKVFDAGEIAELGFIPTASKVYRKSSYTDLPSWVYHAVVGDYPNQLVTTSHGYAYYFNQVMSYYRVGIVGSATSNLNKKSNHEKKEHLQGFIDILKNFNEYSEFKYSNNINKVIIRYELLILKLDKSIIKMRSARYKEFFNNLTLNEKIKFYSSMLFPNLYAKLAIIKDISDLSSKL